MDQVVEIPVKEAFLQAEKGSLHIAFRFSPNEFSRIYRIVRPFRRISFRLSDRSKVTQNKINFVKNFPQWGLN